MGNTYSRQNTTEGRQEPREETRNAPEAKMTLPNSLVSRIMEEPDAEAEADRLSAGVTSGSPAEVRREMGGRLGADLSGVRFHSGPSSVRQSESLGAQAWTQGRNVYFGKSGFTPSLAAHELVHTVQQGAVHGNVSQSMPSGSIQLKPKKPGPNEVTADDFRMDENDGPLPGDLRDLSALETQMLNNFSSNRGVKVYNAIKQDIENIILRVFPRTGDFHLQPKSAISFLVRAAYQDYALRDILTEIAGKGIGMFKAGVRTRQYKALIKSVSDRLGPYQIQELASQAGILTNAPRADRQNERERQVNKRSYEFNSEDPEADKFNPGNIPEVGLIQEKIDNAQTFEEAYQIFANFTGNGKARVTYENEKKDKGVVSPDMVLFRNKLKHMARQVWEYPELRQKIGNLRIFDSGRKANMGTTSTNGGRDKSSIYYNAYYERAGEEAEQIRQAEDAEFIKAGEWNADRDHFGNHELGHILGTSMPRRNGSEAEAEDSTSKHEMEDDIVKEVLLNKDVLTPQQKKQIKFYKSSGNGKGKYEKIPHQKGQLDLQGSPALAGNDITSNYGKSASFEFFAETFGDVYAHGRQAKRASIETVREYEKRQKALQRAKYKYNQSSGFMKIFRKKIL